MAKRQNRLKPIEHEIRQLENLKTLDPIATAPEFIPLSNALIDLAIAALQETYALEAGVPVESPQLQALVEKAANLSSMLGG